MRARFRVWGHPSCVVLVLVCAALKLIKLEKLTLQLCITWAPVNLIFVGMIWTSFFALKYLSVAMLTVLKNSTNLLVRDHTIHSTSAP